MAALSNEVAGLRWTLNAQTEQIRKQLDSFAKRDELERLVWDLEAKVKALSAQPAKGIPRGDLQPQLDVIKAELVKRLEQWGTTNAVEPALAAYRRDALQRIDLVEKSRAAAERGIQEQIAKMVDEEHDLRRNRDTAWTAASNALTREAANLRLTNAVWQQQLQAAQGELGTRLRALENARLTNAVPAARPAETTAVETLARQHLMVEQEVSTLLAAAKLESNRLVQLERRMMDAVRGNESQPAAATNEATSLVETTRLGLPTETRAANSAARLAMMGLMGTVLVGLALALGWGRLARLAHRVRRMEEGKVLPSVDAAMTSEDAPTVGEGPASGAATLEAMAELTNSRLLTQEQLADLGNRVQELEAARGAANLPEPAETNKSGARENWDKKIKGDIAELAAIILPMLHRQERQLKDLEAALAELKRSKGAGGSTGVNVVGPAPS